MHKTTRSRHTHKHTHTNDFKVHVMPRQETTLEGRRQWKQFKHIFGQQGDKYSWLKRGMGERYQLHNQRMSHSFLIASVKFIYWNQMTGQQKNVLAQSFNDPLVEFTKVRRFWGTLAWKLLETNPRFFYFGLTVKSAEPYERISKSDAKTARLSGPLFVLLHPRSQW